MRAPANARTRYRVDYDPEAQFEECNGEARPLTEAEYAENSCRACPDHPRAGTVVIDPGGKGRPQVKGCAVCRNTAYVEIPYEEYLAYYGNPDRHVYLVVQREDRCPYCDTWIKGGSVWGIDYMDDSPEAGYVGDSYTLEQLPGYLRDVAADLDPDDAIATHQ